MSVTFYVESNITDEGFAVCGCGGGSESVGSYDNFNNFVVDFKERNTPLNGCDSEYCFAMGNIFFHAGSDIDYDAPELNVSNFNAQSVFDALGIQILHEEYFGEMSPDDLEGRILIALAVSPVSAERPASTEGNISFCGREEGYVQEKLIQIQEICSYARTINRNVVWA